MAASIFHYLIASFNRVFLPTKKIASNITLKIILLLYALVVVGCGADGSCPEIRGNGAPLASLNSCGKLSYGLYANQGQSNLVNRLPDFSYAGYQGGGVVIPTVPVVATLVPVSGDNRSRIQAAIDQAGNLPMSNGVRGAVLLKRGTYEISDTLYIRKSGVVLRGEGQGGDGTVIVSTKLAKGNTLEIVGAGDGLVRVTSPSNIRTSYVPVGSREFEIASISGLSTGDYIAVVRTPNATWLSDLNMAQFGWTTANKVTTQERRITNISGNQITIDAPIVDTIESRYGGGYVQKISYSQRLQNVGVEDLRLKTRYSSNTDGNSHAWRAVILDKVNNSWVRRVSTLHYAYASVQIQDSSFNTIEEVAYLDPVGPIQGGYRYSFVVIMGTNNLFQRCYSQRSRHDFVVQAQVTGPNVWLDSYASESNGDQGPHHRWSTGSLFDNIRANYLHVENREESGTGHGWSGAQTLFWNSTANGFRVFSPRGAMNWSIGGVGVKESGGWTNSEAQGWWESHGKAVAPRSLYLQQLKDRLGEGAVGNVVTAKQRSGRIWTQLQTWAGEGRLADY